MKNRSGLHKKISSIFEGATLPSELSGKVKEPLTTHLPTTDFGSAPARQPHQFTVPIGATSEKAGGKIASGVAEQQGIDESQKKKLYMVIGLAALLVLVLVFELMPGKKNAAGPEQQTAAAMQKATQINWQKPQAWSDDIRDPMVLNSYARKGGGDGSLVIRGIVRPPQGRSSVLIGTDILYEGDKIQGWTVKQILPDAVELEKPDGQKKELKWN